MKDYKKLIELPLKGKALIITDLHGNLEDYNKVHGDLERIQ